MPETTKPSSGASTKTRSGGHGLLVGQARVYRGRDEIMRYFEFLGSEFDDLRFEVKHLMDAGDLVVAEVYVSGVGKQSKAPVEVHFAVVSRWRNGKLLNAHNFMTRHEALEAAGLSEQDAHADS